MTTLQTVDLILRDRPGVRARIDAGASLVALARTAILTILAGAAVFGAAIGGFRGGIQILFAGVKLPLVVLLTAAVCAPALTALRAAFGAPADLRRDLALVLSSLALGSLVLAALAPVVLLAVSLGLDYHKITLLVVACCIVAGLVGMRFFTGGLASATGRWTIAGTLLAVFFLVGAQMSWTFRPYLVRPRADQVVFLRSVEGNFIESVTRVIHSARGNFRRMELP
jgi:hypothetical protein